MTAPKNIYNKNFSLIGAFLVLITILMVVALVVAYNFTESYVKNEFASKKLDVLEQTIKPYNDFFQNRIPEITSYQGFLDSSSAANYARSVFHDYLFVKQIRYSKMGVSSKPASLTGNYMDIAIKYVFQYEVKKGVLQGKRMPVDPNNNDFRQIATKFNNYIATADTTRLPSQDEIYRTFYDVSASKISYLNIPRREDIRAYQALQKGRRTPANFYYNQNMMTFMLDVYTIRIKNTHPELYKEITVQPVVYDPLDTNANELRTEVALSGAFADYKLYFSSPTYHLDSEINRRFIPTGSIVLLIYIFLVVIGWLIYRNLNVNLKLFKLQYDFINNFTHEFKTPVSVIKIAGSNLRGEGELTERARKHYGKILDEEADKLNDLMNKLLSFTQIENRSIKINKQEVNLDEFVQRYLNTFKIKYPDLDLGYKIDGVYNFYTDPVLLGSIFQNLIENAYKYSNPGQKELFIYIRYEKRNIIFSFTDKGIGIPKDEINNVFKKFYRIENKYNQNGSVGLGLAFCKELVNFMNGDLQVKSKVNEGSEFIVTLPFEN
ncbi:HAMP domain-containing histidine kinase [Mucilaginibacter daejeonensis]|uniref:sensor histidine kinase n=1 Tax=Mucilaginibacter daejeonensis TaxID=398049 RepID=UPI001D174E54|nr:HAMP domain-containing sensor histidine kinase [Mucilaginibacter daejeonensis]UEG53979.1 HAMP domain-containing histidine kinase [Mucilaginibacter daejeonensis]